MRKFIIALGIAVVTLLPVGANMVVASADQPCGVGNAPACPVPSGTPTESPSLPPGNDGDLCHGQNQEDCRPDPNPNGQDCEAHGNNPDGNDDHCDETPTPSPTPSPTPPPTCEETQTCESPSPTPTETPSPTPSETPSPTPTESPSPSPSETPSPSPSDTPTTTPPPVPTTTPAPPTPSPSPAPVPPTGPTGPEQSPWTPSWHPKPQPATPNLTGDLPNTGADVSGPLFGLALFLSLAFTAWALRRRYTV